MPESKQKKIKIDDGNIQKGESLKIDIQQCKREVFEFKNQDQQFEY